MQHQSSLYKTAYIAYIPRGRRGLFYSPFGGKKINMEEKKKSTTASQLILLIQGARGGWIWDFPDKHLRDKRSCQLSVGHWAISSVMSMMTLKFHFPNPQIWNIVFYLPSGEVESFFFFLSQIHCLLWLLKYLFRQTSLPLSASISTGRSPANLCDY